MKPSDFKILLSLQRGQLSLQISNYTRKCYILVQNSLYYSLSETGV